METGVRYLDIRIAYKNNKWIGHHGPIMFHCDIIDNLITPISKWLNNKGKEILIIEFSHFIGDHFTSKEASDIFSKIVNILGGKDGEHILLNTEYKPSTLVKNIKGEYNKVILIWNSFDNNKDTQNVNWKSEILNDCWNNKKCPGLPSNWTSIKNNYILPRLTEYSKDTFKMIQVHYQQNASDLLKEASLFNPFKPSLIAQAKIINKEFKTWIQKNKNTKQLNIIELDGWGQNITYKTFYDINNFLN